MNEQPPCLKTALLNPNACIAREDPNEPKVAYRYQQDCYPVAAPGDVLGRLRVYAVTEGTPRERVAQGRLLGQIALGGTAPQQVMLALSSLRPNECLAIADAGGQTIPVRGSSQGSDTYTFATAAMRADKTQAALNQQAARDRDAAERLRAQLEQYRQAVVGSSAWKSNRCVAPSMRALPPEPTVMPQAEAQMQARAACAMALSSQVGSDMVSKATFSLQVFEYSEAVARYLPKPTSINACARQGYRYAATDLAALRGESARQGIRGGGADIGAALQGMVEGYFRDATMTTEGRHSLIVEMLNSCTGASVRNCTAPRLAWQEEVERIRREPQTVLAKCESDLGSFSRVSEQLKAADEKARVSAQAARREAGSASTARVSLVDAACSAAP